ncbi:hypothetical protein FP2506_16699 [Fulvimarina pelagi HTCC2506]|uniref:EamA domain-containing protein n=1 Tax=Fulvimarina pelagi HTCC2506 TaxID=314231 RepID=Q0G2U0_9HYPH|nr:DMT family transporter [Fulvimarina pelagi]EAU42091.1 hypothetical protein FP2506_16699 [Fulvimarina pelagi HTCC2506]
MSSIVFGAIAAMAWGVHDLLIRFVTRSLGTIAALFAVLGLGTVLMAVVILTIGIEVDVSTNRLLLPIVSGLAYFGACHGLYRAMAIGPFALAAPIIAAYPVLSVAWAVTTGTRPALLDWLATAAIIGGVVVVSRFAKEEETRKCSTVKAESRRDTIIASLYSAVGFAVAFAAGQAAAADQNEIAITAIARAFAVAAVLPFVFVRSKPSDPFKNPGRIVPLVLLVASLDVIAVTSVVAAGTMEAPELAVVVASSFGVITIVLARIFLKEHVAPIQWLGIAMVFVSVMILSTRY